MVSDALHAETASGLPSSTLPTWLPPDSGATIGGMTLISTDEAVLAVRPA